MPTSSSRSERRPRAHRPHGAVTVSPVDCEIDHRYRIGRVCRVGLLDGPHVVGVAVVSRDQNAAARPPDGSHDPAQLLVDGLDSSHGRVEVAGVTHHVRVSVVENHQDGDCGRRADGETDRTDADRRHRAADRTRLPTDGFGAETRFPPAVSPLTVVAGVSTLERRWRRSAMRRGYTLLFLCCELPPYV